MSLNVLEQWSIKKASRIFEANFIKIISGGFRGAQGVRSNLLPDPVFKYPMKMK